MSLKNNWYKILEVKNNDNIMVIRKAYKKLALIHHPDKNNGDDVHFKVVQGAYEYRMSKEEVNKDKNYMFQNKWYQDKPFQDKWYQDKPCPDKLEEIRKRMARDRKIREFEKIRELTKKWYNKKTIIGKILVYLYINKDVKEEEMKEFIKKCGSKKPDLMYNRLMSGVRESLIIERHQNITNLKKETREFIDSL